MYMNVIRTVICTLIIVPVGLQAATSHSSMAKDTITIVATGNQNTVFETPSMVSVVTNDTPWSQNAVTSAGMLKGVAGLSQTGAGRTNGQTFNLRGYDKSGVLVLVDGVRQLSDMAKSSGTYLDPALVKRIEVVRGPNSSLYGSGGLGGVVDFRIADAADFLPPGVNRPGFPGECFICELRLPDHRFRWKHNKLFLLLPVGYGPAFPAIVDCYTSPPT